MYQETAMTQDDHYQIARCSRILSTMTFADGGQPAVGGIHITVVVFFPHKLQALWIQACRVGTGLLKLVKE